MTSGVVGVVGGTSGYITTWRYREQLDAIKRVASNSASLREDDFQLFEYGLRHSQDFLQLTVAKRRRYEKKSRGGGCLGCSSKCCSSEEKRKDAELKARRLRVALRRVTENEGRLPPSGPPLIPTDRVPIRVHTPPRRRLREEQQAQEAHPYRARRSFDDRAFNQWIQEEEQDDRQLRQVQAETIRLNRAQFLDSHQVRTEDGRRAEELGTKLKKIDAKVVMEGEIRPVGVKQEEEVMDGEV